MASVVLQSLPTKLWTIVYPAERRAFGFRTPLAERHSIVAFVQKVDAEQVAIGIEAGHDLPVSDLESDPRSIEKIPIAPPTKHRLSFLRVHSHDSLEDVYLQCQASGMDLNICTDVRKSKGSYEFEATNWEVPDNLAAFRNRLSFSALFDSSE